MRRLESLYIIAVLLVFAMLPLPGGAFAQHSASSHLATGNWWKVAVAEEGIYALSCDDISDLAGCSVDDIALFGNPGGVLNVSNSAARTDDLAEMAVRIVDNNGNGIFDSDDRILFYASGPVSWAYSENDGRFVHQPHPYSRANYVYVTISQGSHLRISTQQPPQAGSASTSSCHMLFLHENDLTNIFRSGQTWVGERFYGSNTQQTFTIALPSAPSGSVKVRYALASISSSGSNFSVSVAGSTRTLSFSTSTKYNTFSDELPSVGNANVSFSIKYNPSESMASGYLDYIEADAVVPITANPDGSLVRIPPSANAALLCNAANAGSSTLVWDVTDYNQVAELSTTLNSSTIAFTLVPDRWRTLILFSADHAKRPLSVSKIANQNIHGAPIPDMVIVSHSAFLPQAQRLASLHSIIDDLSVLVVEQNAVFNEFSSGQTDPMAIREMMRMFRNRALASDSPQPRYLLLFGKGTYDNRDLKGLSQPTVVTYQTAASFDDDGISMATDDIFTYLDDNEAVAISSTMDVAVGRLPAKNAAEAEHLVNKIEQYLTRSDLLQNGIRGDWRNCVALLADDADPSCGSDTVFTSSSEFIARSISKNHPHITIDKIYADAYVQQSGADGSFYPDVNNALDKRINYGCLLLNYIGHGSSQYIGTERFLMKSHLASYANLYQLPFFVTSTCTFGRYDDPEETCGAEEFLLVPGAGIGCLAASRPIAHIQAVNADMVLQSLDPSNAIGDAVRRAKNNRPTTQALTLIGDPALHLSHPIYDIVVTAVNGRPVDSLRADTALVLSTVYIDGEIRDKNGALVSDFDGDIFPEVYDRARITNTLANDNSGYEVAFSVQNSLLYRGHATVSGGRFSYHFTIPRDVAYKFEPAKLSHYAKSASVDASGAYTNLYLGGFDETVMLSESRPSARLFINDTNFRNGGITDNEPTLIAILFDSTGINAVGSGLGHDITATLDNNPNNIIILNDFYETDINDERFGSIRYNLGSLAPGRHHLSLKVWNIFNYSNSADISFIVTGSDTTALAFNAAPNPTSDHVALRLEHNLKGLMSSASLTIFDMQGRPVRYFDVTPSADSYVVGPVEWNLLDANGRRVRPGIYVALFTATTTDGDKLTENGKIIVK